MKTFVICFTLLGLDYQYTVSAQRAITAINRAYRMLAHDTDERGVDLRKIVKKGELIIHITEGSCVL